MMKNIALIWMVLLSCSLCAQTVVLPDSGFKACLQEKYSSLLDTNQNLIIAAAEAHTGFLSCMGSGIKSIEGFQYFKNVKEVFFSSNQISEISAWPVSDSIERLVLDDNQLTQIPDLSVLPQLKTVVIRRNQLTSLPDLSANGKITQLYVQSNQLTELPDLSNLIELRAINVSNNQLRYIPSLSSSTKLVEIKVEFNQLTEIPSLVNNTLLETIDFSKNQLTTMPEIPIPNVITLLELENNRFIQLPDFTLLPNLAAAYLNDNSFTFKDLITLTELAYYEKRFPLNSQKLLTVGGNYLVEELKTLYLTTQVDSGVSGVIYTWYYNGEMIQTSNNDSLKVLTDSVAMSGTYYCELTHPAFPNLVLKTSLYQVGVKPCFVVDQFNIEVTPRSCELNTGSVEIRYAGNLPAGFSYRLSAEVSGETFESTVGKFSGLGERTYILNGGVGNCKKEILAIEIGETECLNVHISPDSDGMNDSYYFNEEGEVIIQNKFGHIVTELQIPASWNGESKSGKVAPGLYYANINDGEKLVKITVIY